MNIGAFPGAALRIANKTHTIYANNYGHLSLNSVPFGSPAVNNDTFYDIASLSKVTGTLACIIELVDQGKLSVDDLVSKHIPEYGNNGKQPTIVQNLLLHNAGLLPDYPGKLPDSKQKVMDFIYNCKLESPIGTKFVYSDLSFILLGEITERLMGMPLDQCVNRTLNRLEIYNTTFLINPANIYRTAPTEVSGNIAFTQLSGTLSFGGKCTIPLPTCLGESPAMRAYSRLQKTCNVTCKCISTRASLPQARRSSTPAPSNSLKPE